MFTIGFCGSGAFAADCLARISASVKPKWVITNAPKPAGRGMQLRSTEVSLLAEELNIPCKTTKHISSDTELLSWLSENCPDIIFVIDFGHIIKEPMLSMPRLGCINIHPSKLPQYRGSAPVQTALIDGADSTAVTIFRLNSEMDAGPILSQVKVKIDINDNTASLLAKCAEAGCDELIRFLMSVPENDWKFTPQDDEGISLAPKIEKSKGKITWDLPAESIYNIIRAIGDSTGAFCMLSGKRLRIHKAVVVDAAGSPSHIISIEDGFPIVACGSKALKLAAVQPEGKKVQS
ncbi:MAG: methionyl-tRNA formyltransferase, partial [Synergistaceae bacterium]